MKKISRIIIIILVAVFVLTGCGVSNEAFSPSVPRTTTGGVHSHKATETSGYIVKDGKTDYKILLASDADSYDVTAANELTKFFYEGTGIELETVEETAGISGKFIAIGDTNLKTASGLSADAEVLKKYGYRVVTKDSNIFLFGASGYGSIYAVYELLGNILDYEFFFTDTYRLNLGVREIKLMNYDITEVPDIEYRAGNYGYMRESIETQHRLRITPYEEFFMLVDGFVAHNSTTILPESKHPDHVEYWYNTNKTQLCYTAHGNTAEYALMVEASALRLIQALKEYPDRDVVTFTTQDNSDTCECSACIDKKMEYGAHSAAVILFLNDVRKKMNALLITDEYKQYNRDFDILFFAYASYLEAPATKNKTTGEYTANKGIQCEDGVAVWLAPIHADFTYNMTADENLPTREKTSAWQSVSESIYLWYYSTNFRHYLVPYDTFDAMSDTYKYVVETGAKMLFNQAQYDNSGSATGFSTLKGYLNAKLAWNVNLNMNELITEFFETCYGDAAPIMHDLFDELRVHVRMLKDEKLGYDGVFSCYNDYSRDIMWPKQVLNSWKGYINEALETIGKMKDVDPDMYSKQYFQIVNERVWINYLLVRLYSHNTSDELVSAMKQEVVDDFAYTGMNKYIESHDISELYKTWGIN